MSEDHRTETKLTVHQRDLPTVAEQIAGWLPVMLGSDGPVTVSDVHSPEGAGMSTVTVLFTATWSARGEQHTERLVARLAPDLSSFPVFPQYDLQMQHDVISAVGRLSDVPVPQMLGIEPTGSVADVPFLVMKAVEGRTPADNPPYVFVGWLFDAEPAERRALQDATVSVLAGIHDIEVSPTDFAALIPDGDPLRAHVASTRAYYEWTCADDGVRIPVLERAFAWLDENWPATNGDPVLSWGDARPGNIIFDGFAPAAVLDWEMAAIAPREVDLGWLVFLHRFFQDIATMFNFPGVPDFCRRDDIVTTYEAVTGYTVRDLDWFVVYAALRQGVVMARIKRRMIHFGEEQPPANPDEYVMHHASLTRLLDGTYSWD